MKRPEAGKDWGQEKKGTTEDEVVGWHHQLSEHGFGWTPGVGDGQGGLVCCDSWGHKESDTTEWLNWTELRFVIAFLPRNKCLNLTVAVTICSDFAAQENKVCCFHFYPIYCHEVLRPDAMILVFWMLSFKPAFSLSFTFIKRLFSTSSLSAIRVVSYACVRLLIFFPAILIPAWIIQPSTLNDVSSVQFSDSFVSDSLQPHELQYARPPCLSPTPGVHPNPCPVSLCNKLS